MSNHPAYEEESKHLEEIKSLIENKDNELEKKIEDFTKRLFGDISLRRNVSDEAVIAKQIEQCKKQQVEIDKYKSSPYFARMDFKYANESIIRRIYLGKCFIDLNDENMNIYDWRSPIGDIFYKGGLGDCESEYKDELGHVQKIKGKKYLKRKIEIIESKIINIKDNEVAKEIRQEYSEIFDECLVEFLNGSSDFRLKDIVSTIQEEQNRIIREDIDKIVYIQGCAGSGKSTIALHRVAYLIYNNKLNDEDILVIGPNKLFMSYISNMLPELGSKSVKHYTYRQLAEWVIGERLNVKDNIELLNMAESQENNDVLKFKGSIEFKNILENCVRILIDDLLPKKNISILGKILYSYDSLKEIFSQQFNVFSINEGIDSYKTLIDRFVRGKVNELIKNISDSYANEIESINEQIDDRSIRQEEINNLNIEEQNVINRITRQTNIILDQYLKRIRRIDAIQCYQELIVNKDILMKASENRLTDSFTNNIIKTSVMSLVNDKPSVPI